MKGSDDKEDKRNPSLVPVDGVPANRVLPETSSTLGDDKRVAAVYTLKMSDRARLPFVAWIAKDKELHCTSKAKFLSTTKRSAIC